MILAPELAEPGIERLVPGAQAGEVLVEAAHAPGERLHGQGALEGDLLVGAAHVATVLTASRIQEVAMVAGGPGVAADPDEARAHSEPARRVHRVQRRHLLREEDHHCGREIVEKGGMSQVSR